MATVALTKIQRQTLTTMRGILRNIRAQYDSRHVDNSEKQDVTIFTRFVVAQYKEGRSVTDRSKVKAMRSNANDFLAYLNANKAQHSLVTAYGGSDPDKPAQRHAAARFVGLTFPESVPLGRSAAEFASRYDLASKIAVMEADSDLSRLSGLEHMKAQYYGIEAGAAGAAKIAGKDKAP